MDFPVLDEILNEPEDRTDEQQYTDGWQNAFSGLGMNAYDRRNSSEFLPDLLDNKTALNLWRGNYIAAKAIEAFPKIGTREGFELSIQTPDDGDPEKSIADADKVKKRWKELKLKDKLRQWASFGNAFGGALIILGVRDGVDDLTKPLNIETVRSLDWLTVIEADEFAPVAWYANPRHEKFGEPAIFQVVPISPGNDVDNAFLGSNITQIHETRTIYHPGIRTSRRQISATSHGDSILNRIYRLILDCGEAHSSVGLLLQEFGFPVFKIKGLAQAMKAGDTGLIPARMRGMQLSKSVFRGVMMDLEEEFSRITVPVAGMADLLDRLKSIVAAALDMPVTFLFGTSPDGMNSTGDADIRFLYDNVAAWVDDTLIEPITRITEILFHVERNVPENWSVTANPLWQQTDKEIAETRKIVAETDAMYIRDQVYEPIDVTRSRFGGDEYSIETTVDMDEMERLAAEPDPEPVMAPGMIPGEDPNGKPPVPGEEPPDPADDDKEDE